MRIRAHRGGDVHYGDEVEDAYRPEKGKLAARRQGQGRTLADAQEIYSTCTDSISRPS